MPACLPTGLPVCLPACLSAFLPVVALGIAAHYISHPWYVGSSQQGCCRSIRTSQCLIRVLLLWSWVIGGDVAAEVVWAAVGSPSPGMLF
jgi:hypothetical protein